ncbi:MAG: hypothetical protein ABIS28_07525 [Caldimonas sp.]
MNAIWIETAICAGAASVCTGLVGAYWHRRRTRAMLAHIARLHAELERVRTSRSLPAHAELGRRFDASAMRPLTATPATTAPSPRRRLWTSMRARVRSLGDRRAGSLSMALPFLDTVATTRHTPVSHDPN